MLEFGNVPLVADMTRERWGWLRMESWAQDLRYALRQLWRTLVNAVLLENLPVVDPKALVRVGDWADCCQNSGPNTWHDGDYSMFSTPTHR